MKADQLNRFMRANGRKNLWLLRNTNQIYEHAVKSYYQRSNSLLPYNPKSQEVKIREENRAPVRTLTSQMESSNLPDYPRNHKQMADQATSANSGNLLNTVMQASRRRSMSFTGSMPSYLYNSNNNNELSSARGSGSQRPSRERRRDRQTATRVNDEADEIDVSLLNGRSISLPPRTTLELGMSYTLAKGKNPPCHKHHVNAIEKSANAAVAALARHKNEAEKLMIVDQKLKDRLAVRFDGKADDEPSAMPSRFALGFGSGGGIMDGRPLPNMPKSYTMPSQRAPTAATNAISKEQTRFQTLGERIRQFEVIQFADGPVTYQAFNRRHGYANSRVQPLASHKHLPKQEPCLSFRNVLHTNHRQRNLNSRSQSLLSKLEPQLQVLQSPEASEPPQSLSKGDAKTRTRTLIEAPQGMQLATTPLGPLEPLAPNNRRPQLQQQQQTIELASRQHEKNPSKSSMNRKQSKGKLKLKTREKSKPKIREQRASPLQTAAYNKMSRSSHLCHIQDSSADKPSSSKSPPTAPVERKASGLRKLEEPLPKQPHVVKGAHHLLASSASQVSAYRRAFKNRQQILQAELLHIHVQDQLGRESSPGLPRPNTPLTQQDPKEPAKVSIKQPTRILTNFSNPTKTIVRPESVMNKVSFNAMEDKEWNKDKYKEKEKAKHKLKDREQATSMADAVTTAKGAGNSLKHMRSTMPILDASSVVLDRPSSSSRALQQLQQQQLHQQLRHRRQQPLESLWRYNR